MNVIKTYLKREVVVSIMVCSVIEVLCLLPQIQLFTVPSASQFEVIWCYWVTAGEQYLFENNVYCDFSQVDFDFAGWFSLIACVIGQGLLILLFRSQGVYDVSRGDWGVL